GEMIPSLNVYPSFYLTAYGFERYYIQNRMTAPLFPIGDPRVAGGSVYLGSPEHEQVVINVIDETLEQLNCISHELILS
ncbi:accessory Sec system protein Asp2, partial [Staphylococcus aureus]